ncbi:hypothetical protein Enr13x_05230 [Stieleria neptunia]|uniref:Uncharacterized protein n=1 Tax=Stieleria neptunia TaxID=2527979 RepID=A0A518HIL2_9BACT|nr:hypothetical protein Enr13x_05230 [Stieleria neptunia]
MGCQKLQQKNRPPSGCRGPRVGEQLGNERPRQSIAWVTLVEIVQRKHMDTE